MGPGNGAGKSTMMKCLFGTYQKDEKNPLDGREVSFSGTKGCTGTELPWFIRN